MDEMVRFLPGLIAVGGAGLAFVAALWACNVKIDPSVLDDAGADAFAPSTVSCHVPEDCKSHYPCITPRCDLSTDKCVFEVCPTGDQCTAVSCTTINECGRTAAIHFHGSFAIPEGLACPSCVGAVFPWVFVASTRTLHAYRVSDPTDSTPPEVPVTALGFTPKATLTVGRRVYFVGGPAGTNGAPYQLQVAFIDVPADPGVPVVRAHLTAYPFPSPDLKFDGVVAGSDDQLFSLHRVSTTENMVTVFRDQELLMHVQPDQDPGQLNFVAAANYPANGHTIGFSNGRLVVYRADPANGGAGTFSFDTQPGVTGASNSGETPLPDMGTPGAVTFAQTADGAIYWSAALRKPPVPNTPQQISGVRIALATDGGNAFTATSPVDLEVYDTGLPEQNGPISNPYVGPIATIGNGAAIALASARENPQQTSVQVLTRNGATLALVPGKRFLVNGRADQVAVAGIDGYGYVVNPDTPTTMTVHMLSTGCQ
jgi:hypothetical protein